MSIDKNKIIVLGLAESGKSTIIKAVTEGEIPPISGAKYSATINYERKKTTVMGNELTLFDLGGQVSFLDRFTGELAEFVFSNVEIFLFVIDSTKFEEVSRVKYYLDLCLKNLSKHSPEAKKFIFLHKVDLLKPDMIEIIVEQIKVFLLDDDKDFEFYPTTVYNESLNTAMNNIFSKISSDDVSLDSAFEQFMKKNSSVLHTMQIYSLNGKSLTKGHGNTKAIPILGLIDQSKDIMNGAVRGAENFIVEFSIETNEHIIKIKRVSDKFILYCCYEKSKMFDNKINLATINKNVDQLAQTLQNIKL